MTLALSDNSALVVLAVAAIGGLGSIGAAWVAVRAQRSVARAEAATAGKALSLDEARFIVEAHKEEIARLDGVCDDLRRRVGELEHSLRAERERCDGLARELAVLRGGAT